MGRHGAPFCMPARCAMSQTASTHFLLGRLNGMKALGALLREPLPPGLAPQQIRILSGELPPVFDASQWHEDVAARSATAYWVTRGMLFFLPIGLIGLTWGQEWLWLPGMVLSGAVWGWFAHFYWRLFRSDRAQLLQHFPFSQRDRLFIRSELADGAVVLVLTLQPHQLDGAERWLASHAIPAYHVLR